jgi:hypothetical protein
MTDCMAFVNNKFAISLFLRITPGTRVTDLGCRRAARDRECHRMFIFSRTFRAVGAGLAVALLTVCLDRACEPPAEVAAALPAAASIAKAAPSACAAPAACGIVRAGS